MAIVQSINNVHQFREAFRIAGRMDQFSYEGLEVLFDYLDNLSEDTGESIDLDVVGFCCDYNEDTFSNIASNYRIDLTDRAGESIEDEEEIKRIVLDYLNENTVVCGVTGTTAVYAVF